MGGKIIVHKTVFLNCAGSFTVGTNVLAANRNLAILRLQPPSGLPLAV